MKFKPMLAVLGSRKDLKKGFIYEPKLDGYRALCFKNKKLEFYSRKGRNITKDYPELNFLKNIKCKSAVLDGEIVAFDRKGIPNFQILQNKKNDSSIKVSYIVFDILMKDGKYLMNLPLIERKKILKEIITEGRNFFVIDFTENFAKLWKEIKKIGLEGVMAKRKDGSYLQKRSDDWIKIKITRDIDCVIIGYTSQKNKVSSLLLGVYDGKLKYVGKVGTGFTELMRKELEKKFRKYETNKRQVQEKIADKKVTWLKPKLVCTVHYSEITKDRKLRAPVFKGLREDKNPKELIWKQN